MLNEGVSGGAAIDKRPGLMAALEAGEVAGDRALKQRRTPVEGDETRSGGLKAHTGGAVAVAVVGQLGVDVAEAVAVAVVEAGDRVDREAAQRAT